MNGKIDNDNPDPEELDSKYAKAQRDWEEFQAEQEAALNAYLDEMEAEKAGRQFKPSNGKKAGNDKPHPPKI